VSAFVVSVEIASDVVGVERAAGAPSETAAEAVTDAVALGVATSNTFPAALALVAPVEGATGTTAGDLLLRKWAATSGTTASYAGGKEGASSGQGSGGDGGTNISRESLSSTTTGASGLADGIAIPAFFL
jgi:hypothetical protein